MQWYAPVSTSGFGMTVYLWKR